LRLLCGVHGANRVIPFVALKRLKGAKGHVRQAGPAYMNGALSTHQ
jgi:hypothetical protein